MKNYSSFCIKALLFLAFIAISSNSFSQTNKSDYQLKYTTGTGRSVSGDLVTMTFYVLNLNSGDSESLATLIRAQDGVKNVKMSPVSAENNALLAITISKTFTADLVQKMLKKVGFKEVIVDDVVVPIDNLHDYMSNLNKQKQKNK